MDSDGDGTDTKKMKALPDTWLRVHHSLIITVLAVLSLSYVQAQGEIFFDCNVDDYYGDLLSSSPENWQPSAISNILRLSHRNVLPYSSSAEDVWDALIDLDSTDGLIRLIYRQVLVDALEFGTPETWNREHLWPRSRGVQESGPDNTDVHALRPADWHVNAVRNNLFFGDCEDACTSRPADEEAADDTARNSLMFLPPESVRGDIARAIFYMERRYSFVDDVDTEVLELTDCPDIEAETNQMAYLSDLLQWHEDDPPDDAERRRNDRVCARWQGNRNPFVDFPQLVASFYGPPADKPYDCGSFEGGDEILAPTTSPTPVSNTTGGETPGPGIPVSVSGRCSDLSAGDVQIVSLSASNPDAIVLVALTDLPAGLELYMTDNSWTGTDFNENEGTMKVGIGTAVGRACC
jgi:endonuclease I